MIIDPKQYTQLVEEVRTLKSLNDVLTYQNRTLLNQYINEKNQKENLNAQFIQFTEKVKIQHEQLFKSCQQEVNHITEELSKKKQEELQYFEKKVTELQKGSHQRLKVLQIEFKDYRLKSYLNDEFVNRMLKLYGAQNNPGLPQLYLWIKKIVNKQRKCNDQVVTFLQLDKENKKTLSKALQRDKTKKKILGTSK